MGSNFQMHQFFRTTPLAIDTSSKYFKDEDSTLLDDSTLDTSNLDSGLEMSPHMADSRRESFAVGAPLFSPKAENWDAVDMQSIPSTTGYSEHPNSNNPFMRLDQTQPFGQPAHWAMGNASGTCTPMPAFDGLDFDSGASFFQRPMAGPAPFNNPNSNIFAGLASTAITAGPGSTAIPAPAGQAVAMRKDFGLQAQKKLPATPAVRGDGIRKKNARFDIPADRNLHNIDQLISQSTDDQEIKELKQQKRLLRNRQAALDSRQRKKLHTERLEDEKKHFTALVSDMEEEISSLKTRVEQLMRERQSYQDCVESLTLEKDELIRAHTIETGELRKKVAVLTDHVRRVDGSSALAGGDMPSTEFHGGFDPMTGMTMTNDWSNVAYLNPNGNNGFVDQQVKHEDAEMLAVKKTETTSFLPEADKSTAQGGLLFMLFLVGAFVMSSRSTPNLPQVSDDVRAASATILQNVLKDAGVSTTTMGMEAAMAPQPSAASWENMATMSFGNGNMGSSMLGDLADSLTQPTQEQTNEQLFSLSAAQYNGVNSQDFMQQHVPERTTSQGRRNLADALSNMRGNGRQSAADVYTRSLLWDQVPSEVVRSFAKMVSECNNAQTECGPLGS